MSKIFTLFIALLLSTPLAAQTGPDEDQLGMWYMLFFNKSFGDGPFGIQGDLQYRAWDAGGDMEQLLLRGGLTFRPDDANALFTLGYGNVTSGAFGDSDATSSESRIYQEALLPHKLSNRFRLTHRFRYEQRWVENQDFRTRYRYNIFVNVLLNATEMEKSTLYLALYNELFINGQTDIGDGRTVERFDRNRTYLGLGYALSDDHRVQAGWMRQTTDNWAKSQGQLSLHSRF
ncbi:DUF2490 domain-containing protein [Neolewinella aurantiaca]|uniref:DUF2490 domain-containing protein n=1 Tax=Neolewinella aurantiaca TaxID=2602767 RepID=A0A5C7F5E2_9BACT|nr:DUF2490 domain-containing protein [Neolewinella aurantiaca]TXF83895.1 DUF2490 domain-containing protein [Neolewinella aurantiaca]